MSLNRNTCKTKLCTDNILKYEDQRLTKANPVSCPRSNGSIFTNSVFEGTLSNISTVDNESLNTFPSKWKYKHGVWKFRKH